MNEGRGKGSQLRFRVLAVLVVVLVAIPLGCGGQLSGGGGGGEEGGGEEGQKLGLSISTLNNPFFVTLRDGAQKAADEAGAELIVSDAQNDASRQQNDVQNLVTQQVDAILVNPVDSAAIVPAIESANQSDIPVIAIDRGATGGEVVTLIASDNIEGGRMAAEALIENVRSGPVAQLEGVPGTDTARDRGEGFEEVIDGQGEVNLVASQPAAFDRAEALNVSQNLLQANPEVKGIYAQNDEMALGAVRALGDRAGSEVKVVGFDGIEDALKAIENGTMNATVAQQPDRIGQLGVENAIKAANGEDVPADIPVEVNLVTQENVSEFLK